MREQSVNLAIMISIASSYLKKPIDNKTVFIAEVGLTGELKKVPQIKLRLKELERLGYKKAYIGKSQIDKKEFENLQIKEMKNIKEVILDVFGK